MAEASDRDNGSLADASGLGERGGNLPAFTPEPWFWAVDKHDQRTALMRSGTGEYVISPQADVGNYGLSVDCWNDVSDADAALIAAAPLLCEALSCAVIKLSRYRQQHPETYVGGVLAEYEAVLVLANAALAKARGQ